jgi:laminin, alpha 3/5
LHGSKLKQSLKIIFAQGDNTTDVALDSVVAIPYEKWHLDYIKPKAACVKKDNECLPSTFPLPPSSKKVEFEEDNESMVASDLPPGIVDPDAVLVYLGDSVIDIAGKVPQEGKYVFVVHFYQPDFPGLILLSRKILAKLTMNCRI